MSDRATLVFFSGGEDEVQRAKLAKTSLSNYFEGSVHVVPRKDRTAVRQVLQREKAEASETWTVGNSPRFDINPALDLGLKCIWLYTVPREGEREPSLGKIYIAFSRDRVDGILPVQSNRTSADQVLWRMRGDHDGRGPEVND